MKKLVILSLSILSIAAFAQENLTAETLWKIKRLGGGDLSPNGKEILFTQTRINIDENRGYTDIFIYDLSSNTVKQVTDTPENEFEAKWMKDGNISFLAGRDGGVQLWKIDPKSGKKGLISQFKGNVEGYVLSPDEKRIATLQSVKVSKTLQEVHSDLPKSTARMETDLMYRHWNQWSDENATHIFIGYKNSAGQYTDGNDLMKDEVYDAVVPPFSGTEALLWVNDGKGLIYNAKKKVGKDFATSTNSALYLFDVETLQTVNLTPAQDGYDASPILSPDGKMIAWLNMARNGFESDKNVIQYMDLETKSRKSISLNKDLTINDFQWARDGKGFLFVSPFKGVNQLFTCDMNGAVSQITTGRMNVVHFSQGKDRLILGLQSMIAPTDLWNYDLKTKTLTQLTKINEDIFAKLNLPTIQEKWIKTTDGKEMLTWVLLPTNYKEGQKYPTLLYCQGGPQSMVSQFFSYRWNLMLMASQGYVVIAPNRRGLPGFGQEWNDAISKDWGGQPIRDYLSAVDQVSQEPYVDPNRIGAVGASYGGYSVYFLAGNHEGRFKSFISHCGLFNLESWYGTTEELFFANWDIGGPYWDTDNKELYEVNSPHRYVQNWDTPILVIHGGKDFRVPESEGMQAYQAAQLKGLKSRYLYFPDEGHWVLKPQNGILWQREFFAWLAETL